MSAAVALSLPGVMSVHDVQASTSPASARIRQVAIQGYAFRPKVLTIKRGTTVVWKNHDSAMHTVTFNTSMGSKALTHGATWRHRFTRTGIFHYHCAYHAFMQGTVKVVH